MKIDKSQIQEMVKTDAFRYFLERLAMELNRIDTVRNINPANLNEVLARRIAIEIVENALSEVYETGELQSLQKEVASQEDNIIKKFSELKEY